MTELFFVASSQERRLILTNLHVAAEEGAHRPPLVSRDLVVGLENAALKRNLTEFSRLLEEALDIDHALAERITRDDAGEPIVVAAKALRLTAAVLQRILLFLNPVIGQSVARVFELAHLYDRDEAGGRRAHAGDLAAGHRPRNEANPARGVLLGR